MSGRPLSHYASEKLWKPFGMEQDGVWMVDKAGVERGGCCMSATLRDYALLLSDLRGALGRIHKP